MFKSIFNVSMMLMVPAMAFVSCSDDDDDVVKMQAPEIVQSEQISDNPITLAFSWTASEGATSYSYELTTGEGESVTTVANGSVVTTSIEFVSNDNFELAFDTEYTFSLTALNDTETSAPVSAKVKTGSGPFEMTITNLSYRGATFTVKPADKNILFQTAQISYSRFSEYPTIAEFLEGYEYSYYKMMAQYSNIPWYGYMEMGCNKGDWSWTTRSLTPGAEQIFYCYGVRFNYETNPNDPVSVITPFMKTVYTVPQWEATSKTTFNITEVEQSVGDNGKVVCTVKVTPSDNNEMYLVTFVEDDYLNQRYGGSDFNLMMGRMGDLELMNIVKDYDWASAGVLLKGEQTIKNNETSIKNDASITPGKKYHVVVAGVSADGLQTTEIATLNMTAPTK